jgi:DNA-binding transcriptional LysR family regulator
MNRFEELEAYVAVVDYRGFGNAADKLGIAKSRVSRRVSDLEQRLGVQLLQRTTRRQSMTEAGRAFYQRAARLLDDLNEAEQTVADTQCSLSGKIRLALPLGFGVRQLARPVGDFLAAHPEISMDIDLNDRQVDLIEENIDLAIRIADLEDSSLIARRLASVHVVTCASPEYLRRYGEPRHPEELVDHEVLVYSNVAVGRQWSTPVDGKTVSPRVRYRLSANNGEFLAAVACRGEAIVRGPLGLLQDHIEHGELLPILQQYPRPAIGMYAVYPPGKLISRRVRVLSETIHDYFRDREI